MPNPSSIAMAEENSNHTIQARVNEDGIVAIRVLDSNNKVIQRYFTTSELWTDIMAVGEEPKTLVANNTPGEI